MDKLMYGLLVFLIVGGLLSLYYPIGKYMQRYNSGVRHHRDRMWIPDPPSRECERRYVP